MIKLNREKTLAEFNIDTNILSKGSNKKVYGICHYCGESELRIRKTIKEDVKLTCKNCYSKEQPVLDRYEECKKTRLAVYGHENPVVHEDTQDKRDATNFAKYGARSVMCTEEGQKKYVATSLERYGVPYYVQTPMFLEQVKQTNQETRGYDWSMQDPAVQEKSRQYFQKEFGVDYYTQTEEYTIKAAATNMTNLGVPFNMQHQPTLIKQLNTRQRKYGTLVPVGLGKTEEALREYVKTLTTHEVISNYLFPDSKKSLDIYIPKLKLAIEYCGLYWHNDCSPSSRGKRYHVDKHQLAAKHGIRLITIFEDEYLSRPAQVKGFISSKIREDLPTVYAKDCTARFITSEMANVFTEAFHVQGASSSTRTAVGLFLCEELVGCMIFGNKPNPAHAVKKEIYLNRLCFKPSLRVVGGSSKLLSIIISWAKSLGVHKIVSWSDNRWSEGNVYRTIGFSLVDDADEDFTYVTKKKPLIRHPKQFLRKLLSEKNRPEDLKHLTRNEYSKFLGFAKVWDCGKKKWELTIS